MTPSGIAPTAPLQTASAPLTPAHRTYFPALDGVRAIAFLLVFATHYLQMPWGWTGVNIFFVLSGFLITGILYDTVDQPHRVWNFYLRRTLRIFPLYYGLMLLLVLVYPIFRWQWNWHWLIWPAYLGNILRYFQPRGSMFAMLEFAQPLSRTFPRVQLYFGHFWSLCVEEQFYLIWPWVVFGIRDRRHLLRICIAAVILLPLIRVFANHALPQITLDNAVLISATPLPFDALLLGGIVALLRRGPWAARVLPAARLGFVAISVAFLLWLIIYPEARRTTPSYVYPSWAFTWGPCLIDALSACLIVMAIESGSIAFRIFNLRPLRWLGRISYGAYVFHDILHGQFTRLVEHYARFFAGHTRLPIAGVAFLCTLILAWMSFLWFETPFIRLKDRWTRAPIPAAPPQQATPGFIEHTA